MLSKEAQEKRLKLRDARSALSSHFIGIDNEIDKILGNIEAWYLMPEIISRPVIVNLWGLTGVGKTDLVRRLVSALGIRERFAEVQMDARSYYSAAEVLRETGLEGDSYGLILLDEFQKYRTIDEKNAEIRDHDPMADIWSLMSDGKLSVERSIRDSMEYMIYDLMRPAETTVSGKDASTTEAAGPALSKEEAAKKADALDMWTARRIKRLLRLSESAVEIVKRGKAKALELLVEAFRTPSKMYEEVDFSKLLIIVSGNLDEAYTMGKWALGDADHDADLFYDMTKKMTVVDIKNALRRRFRPEQISRLGNTHVIYPSLPSSAYRRIIQRQLSRIETAVSSWISVTFDETVSEAIYRNGVFPVQGTRPVFSTIASMVEAKMPSMILHAEDTNYKVCKVSFKDNALTNDHGFSIESPEEIENIRKRKTAGELAQISVHEAGHLLAYGMLFGRVPMQATARTSSSFTDGFIVQQMNQVNTREVLEKETQVMLAGQAAEQLVYGLEGLTDGSSSDLMKATGNVKLMTQDYGMGELKGAFESPHFVAVERMRGHIDTTLLNYNKVLKEQYDRATKLIASNKKLFEDLVEALFTANSLSSSDMVAIFLKHGITVSDDKDADTGMDLVGKKNAYFIEGRSA